MQNPNEGETMPSCDVTAHLHDVGGYDGDLERSRAQERIEHPRRGRLASEAGLDQVAQAELELESSPEQTAAWLRTEYPVGGRWHFCPDTIYLADARGLGDEVADVEDRDLGAPHRGCITSRMAARSRVTDRETRGDGRHNPTDALDSHRWACRGRRDAHAPA